MILYLLDHWLISNNLQDSVSVTNIIPAIKTDHAEPFPWILILVKTTLKVRVTGK